MNFIIEWNKEHDIQIIESFYDTDWGDAIKSNWPAIKSKKDIRSIIEAEYDNNFDCIESKISFLENSKNKLNDIVSTISKVLDEDWSGIESIRIRVGFCPIAPRDLRDHSFDLPCTQPDIALLNWSAHEMIHFLYFKKWKKLYPNHHRKSYEYPDPVWILSEILAVVLAEDKRIKTILKTDSNLYDNWQEVMVDEVDLRSYFTNLKNEISSSDDFLRAAWVRYQELDQKLALTKRLVS